MFLAFWRTIWTILRKDIVVWLCHPATVAATVVPALAFLLVNALGAAAVGRSPVALVTLDHAPKAGRWSRFFTMLTCSASPTRRRNRLVYCSTISMLWPSSLFQPTLHSASRRTRPHLLRSLSI